MKHGKNIAKYKNVSPSDIFKMYEEILALFKKQRGAL